MPISIFKFFFLLLYLEKLPFHGSILTENKFLVSYCGLELNLVCWAWVSFLSCHRTMSMLSLNTHKHIHTYSVTNMNLAQRIVIQANCFPCCVYWPVTELLNTIVWNTKHDPAKPRVNFYTWSCDIKHTCFLLWPVSRENVFVFVLFVFVCNHSLMLNTNTGFPSAFSFSVTPVPRFSFLHMLWS